MRLDLYDESNHHINPKIQLIDTPKAITLQTFEEFTLNMPENLVIRGLV